MLPWRGAAAQPPPLSLQRSCLRLKSFAKSISVLFLFLFNPGKNLCELTLVFDFPIRCPLLSSTCAAALSFTVFNFYFFSEIFFTLICWSLSSVSIICFFKALFHVFHYECDHWLANDLHFDVSNFNWYFFHQKDCTITHWNHCAFLPFSPWKKGFWTDVQGSFWTSQLFRLEIIKNIVFSFIQSLKSWTHDSFFIICCHLFLTSCLLRYRPLNMNCSTVFNDFFTFECAFVPLTFVQKDAWWLECSLLLASLMNDNHLHISLFKLYIHF